jgi:hypothetical protein
MNNDDANFFKVLLSVQKQLPAAYFGHIQVQNTSGASLLITDEAYMFPGSVAIVSINNTRIEKLAASKKIKIRPFEVDAGLSIEDPEITVGAAKKKQRKKVQTGSSSPQSSEDAADNELLAALMSGETKEATPQVDEALEIVAEEEKIDSTEMIEGPPEDDAKALQSE